MWQSAESWRQTFAFAQCSDAPRGRDRLAVISGLGTITADPERDAGLRDRAADVGAQLGTPGADRDFDRLLEMTRELAPDLPAELATAVFAVAAREATASTGIAGVAEEFYFEAIAHSATVAQRCSLRVELAFQHFSADHFVTALELIPAAIQDAELLPGGDDVHSVKSFETEGPITARTTLIQLEITAAALHAEIGEWGRASEYAERAVARLEPAVDPITQYAAYATRAVLALERNDVDRYEQFAFELNDVREEYPELVEQYPVLAELEFLARRGKRGEALMLIAELEGAFWADGEDSDAFERLEELGPELVGREFLRPNLAARMVIDRVHRAVERGALTTRAGLAAVAVELAHLHGLDIELELPDAELLADARTAATAVIADLDIARVPDESFADLRASARILDRWGPPGASAEWWWQAGLKALAVAGDSTCRDEDRRAALRAAQAGFRSSLMAAEHLPQGERAAAKARTALVRAACGTNLEGRSVLGPRRAEPGQTR